MYNCDCKAVNTSRKVRIQIKQRLKEAFEGGMSEIAF